MLNCQIPFPLSVPKLFCLSFVGFHPSYKWALCFDLSEDPQPVIDMNQSELFSILENSPK